MCFPFIHSIPLPVNGQSDLNDEAYTSNKLNLEIRERENRKRRLTECGIDSASDQTNGKVRGSIVIALNKKKKLFRAVENIFRFSFIELIFRLNF